MNKVRKFISPDDPRLQHLRSAPGAVDFKGPAWDYTNHVMDALAPKPGMAVVYHVPRYSIRYTHLLSHWSSKEAELIIVDTAVNANGDGNDDGTDGDSDKDWHYILKEAAYLLRSPAIPPNGIFTTPSSVRLLRKSPSVGTASHHRDPHQILALQLSQAIGQRGFIFHNEGSFKLLEKLLMLPVIRQLKACTFTGAIDLSANGIRGGGTAWDPQTPSMSAFTRVLDYANTARVPFLSLHSSLSGWKIRFNAYLKGWVQLEYPSYVTGKDQADVYRYMTRYHMGNAIYMSFLAYVHAKEVTVTQARILIAGKLTAIRCAVLPDHERASDIWATILRCQLRKKSEETWNASYSLAEMAALFKCPWKGNTDVLAGCPLDVPSPKRKSLLVLRSANILDKGLKTHKRLHDHQIQIGESGYHPTGGLFFLAYAKESETLKPALSSYRMVQEAQNRKRELEQAAKGNKQFEVIDAPLAREFLLIRELARTFIRGALEHTNAFTKECIVELKRALVNLEKGEMALRCEKVSQRKDYRALFNEQTPSRKSSTSSNRK